MKISILLIVAMGVIVISEASAQEVATPTPNVVTLSDNITMKIGGFLKADAFYDNRKNEEAVEGMILYYPKNVDNDVLGKDINSINQFRIRAISSRLLTKFSGPDVFGAKLSSVIEFDFTGMNAYGLRLRHAYLKLNWTGSEIMFGRYWHPLVPIEDGRPMAQVLALNTGAPFVAFARYEQIRYSFTLDALSAFAALSNTSDNTYPTAADGKTIMYNAVLPDLSVNFQLKTDLLLLGTTGTYKINQPKTFTTGTLGKFKTNEMVNSAALSGYCRVKVDKLIVKGGLTFGENMREFNMLGGFAIKSIEPTTGKETYATLNNMYYWSNITYGAALQGGVFLGYSKNLGADAKVLTSSYYARGEDIDHIIRIAPQILYRTGKLMFSTEVENTLAAYGLKDSNNHGRVKVNKNISNMRIQFTSLFYF